MEKQLSPIGLSYFFYIIFGCSLITEMLLEYLKINIFAFLR